MREKKPPGLLDVWYNEIKTACENSNTLCIAVFTIDGDLLTANPAMKKLFMDSPLESFINPSFETIAKIASDESSVFNGYMTIGSRNSSKNISIKAQVFRRENLLLIIGEVDVNHLAFVNEKLIELNSEVNDLQRKLIKDKFELARTIERLKESQKNVIESESKIRGMLEEKELLIKEVHHRIKNNMLTIHSLLLIQADHLKEASAVAAIQDAGNRVHSMMLLYDKLYRSTDFNEISVADYLPLLVDEIISNFDNAKAIEIEKKVDDFMLNAKKLQPLGIIINELLTNILKYAFTDRTGGLISVSAELTGSRAVFEVADNGAGLPLTIDFEHSTGFGMKLIGMLMEQLKGTIKIERGAGTRFILEFDI